LEGRTKPTLRRATVIRSKPPALGLTHSDGNTSTALRFSEVTRSVQDGGRELVRLNLRDAAYPLEVTLCFRVDAARDLIEQWVEIRNGEPGPSSPPRGLQRASPSPGKF
jgi:hypothetical protein